MEHQYNWLENNILQSFSQAMSRTWNKLQATLKLRSNDWKLRKKYRNKKSESYLDIKLSDRDFTITVIDILKETVERQKNLPMCVCVCVRTISMYLKRLF